MAPKNHVHKYRFINIGKKDKPRFVYACALPDCSHFMPFKQQVVGKYSICWQCDERFIMTANITGPEVRKPRCPDCRGLTRKAKPEEKKKEVILDNAIDNLLSGLKGL